MIQGRSLLQASISFAGTERLCSDNGSRMIIELELRSVRIRLFYAMSSAGRARLGINHQTCDKFCINRTTEYSTVRTRPAGLVAGISTKLHARRSRGASEILVSYTRGGIRPSPPRTFTFMLWHCGDFSVSMGNHEFKARTQAATTAVTILELL